MYTRAGIWVFDFGPVPPLSLEAAAASAVNF